MVMPAFRVILDTDAQKDLDRLKRFHAAAILDVMEQQLTNAPTQLSKSRIKRLRGRPPADYRLRVGDYRVFFRVVRDEVHVVRVMHKKDTARYLHKE
jgi:mRNA-degrading endonuclease RelE of RelBE toxin-antitoxin system